MASPEFFYSELCVKTPEDTSSDDESTLEDYDQAESNNNPDNCRPVLELIDAEDVLILPPEDQEDKNEINTGSYDDHIEAERSSLRRVLKRFGFRESDDDEDWCLYWTDYSVTLDKVFSMKQWQKINHFPGMSEICRKDNLARNLKRMFRLFPKDYNIFPKTWCLPSDWNEVQNYARKHKSKTFIIKPDNGCQGRGIYITKNVKDIHPVENMICQVYIAKPFLINGYKFDLRIYVLLTSCDPLRLFVFKDGLVRFTTNPYSEPNQRNVHDMYMHLTNYAVQKHSDGYIRDDEEGGTKRRITTLNRWFTDNGYDVKKIWEDIDDVIIKTILSGYPMIRHNYRTCFPNHIQTSACFEILGFDIIFNHKLKPYILEVNHSPSFTTDSKLDKEIKEAMLWDSVQLAHFNAVSKKKCCDEERKRIRNRLMHKNIDKYQKFSLERDIEKYQALSEKYENSHMGNFRLIYPSNDLEKYSPFLNPTITFYQETFTYKVRSEYARQLREEIRVKQEKLDLITNKHKQSQSESPAPKRLRIKINNGSTLSQQLTKSINNDEIISNFNQLIQINKTDFTVNTKQNNEESQKKPEDCLNIHHTTGKQEKDSNDDQLANHALAKSTLNNDKLGIDTKIPQPIIDKEEAERKNELKKREYQMQKIGLISILYDLLSRQQHFHALKNESKREIDDNNNNNNSNSNTDQTCIDHQQTQQQIDKKKEGVLNVSRPTASWNNRTQSLGRQKYWIKNHQHENSLKIHQQKFQKSNRLHSGNLRSTGTHSNSSTVNSISGHTTQNLPAYLDCQRSYQDSYDTSFIDVKSYQSIKNPSLDSLHNPVSVPLRTNANCGFLPARSIHSNSALKSKYMFTNSTSCNNNRNYTAKSNSYNNSRQHSHNAARKTIYNGCENFKTEEKYKTPLPTLINPHVNTFQNSCYNSQLMVNCLMPVVTSVKLNRVARRTSNQEYYRTVLNQ
ncbi:unnamed protein product [Schistosoma turkestanicum]|nr:unnamed protein product [Schistosoma turkestanicum]